MDRLSTSDKVLCTVYALVGAAALAGTQIVLFDYVTSGDTNVLDDIFATGAATFATIDLLAVAVVGLIFIVGESRRLRMRFLWVYVVLTFAVAISVALPAFLVARQVNLAGRRDAVAA